MGQEISTSRFQEQDFILFTDRLHQETQRLAQWFDRDHFDLDHGVAGFELEAWLVDAQVDPNPINQDYLAAINDPLVVPELARFNVELNSKPLPLRDGVLGQMAEDLNQIWGRCCQVAQDLEAELLMIGILPTVNQSQLSLINISPLQRYYALNEQILRLRQGKVMELNIQGRDHLHTRHPDIMLESATTSFQIHLQVAPDQAVRCFNAALILSAPMVAIAGNSPYLFAQDLWNETRIPLFEQALGQDLNRVSFGTGYVQQSLLECFLENLDRYPVLLPMEMSPDLDQMGHLRLHNGTIWRWNRPLIGFDPQGKPHLRIEHRVVPAGPTVVDMIANLALFYGAVHSLATQPLVPEHQMSFEIARANFYAAAQYGLEAEVEWLDHRRLPMDQCLAKIVIPMARQGLEQLQLEPDHIDRYLEILSERVRTGQNGSSWQRAYVAKQGRDMQKLTRAYLAHQHSGAPVHEWDLT